MAKKEKVERKKEKKKKGIFSKILIFLLIILIVFAGLIVYRVYENGGGMKGLLLTAVGHDKNTLENLEELQVLVLGISTDISAKLTDTIMVASYNPKTQKASLLSIPRDTFTGSSETNANSYDKINAAYQKGIDNILEKVNKITGLNLKYYVVVDTEALIKFVDTIGGVEFDVPEDLYYEDPTQDLVIDLKKGVQVLNGDKAEQLLRYRKDNNGSSAYSSEYGRDDFGRMRTQREFIAAVVEQTIQAKNILKIKEIMDIVYEYVDTNLSLSVLKDYVPYAIDINTSEIQMAAIPGESARIPENTGLWFFKVDKKQSAELMEELYSEKENNEETNTNNTNSNSTNTTTNTSITKTEASKIKIEILNGSGSTTTLTEVKEKLKKQGYTISKTTSTTSTAKTTIINKTDIDEKYTNNIKEILKTGIISTNVVSSSQVDITIIIGKDYK